MDVKIAFATSDGKNVDTHFGKASAFQIYQLVDGTFTFIEERVVPTESKTAEQNQDCGQKSSSGCGDGSGHGCSCGGAESSPAVDLLLDCTALVAARFGRNVIVWESRTAAPSYGSCIFFAIERRFLYNRILLR